MNMLRKAFSRLLSDPFRDLKNDFLFEFRSAWQRKMAPKQIEVADHDYIQFGCGENKLPGFLNTDCWGNRDADLVLDIRYPLPLPDECVQGIYTHHVVEHIAKSHAHIFFRSCFRILKKGGVLRIVVPDAEKCLRLYVNEPAKLFELYPEWHRDPDHRTPMEVVNYLFRDRKHNRHLYAWDFETLRLRLTEAGFSKCERMKLNKSHDSQMAGLDNPNWENHSLYVEAIK